MQQNIIIVTLFHEWMAYNIPVAVGTCHRKSASNICDHSASYFCSSVRKAPRQYRNI